MITIFVGKSFSGKTTELTKYIKDTDVTQLKTHTTRPVRPTETGNEYYFDTDESFNQNQADVIAPRTYNTIQGKWVYWMEAKDFADKKNVATILDLYGTKQLVDFLKQKGYTYKVIYVNTSWGDIINRVRFSNRSTEDIKETLRRLEDDANKFEQLDIELVKRNSNQHGLLDITDLIDIISFQA